jgi:hypothetical protein
MGTAKTIVKALPAVAVGMGAAAIVPTFVPAKIRAMGNGWADVLLSILAGAGAVAVASRSALGRRHTLKLAMGAAAVVLQKAVAKATSPDSKLRQVAGIGLSDLGAYAGMVPDYNLIAAAGGSLNDYPLIPGAMNADDVLAFENDGIASSLDAPIGTTPDQGMADAMELSDQVEVGLNDQVEFG